MMEAEPVKQELSPAHSTESPDRNVCMDVDGESWTHGVMLLWYLASNCLPNLVMFLLDVTLIS